MSKSKKASYISKFNPKNLDFFGSEFQLNYTQNGKFQTKLGGFMWIGVVICMIAVAYSSFRSLISTDSPATSVSNLYSREAPRFDLYKEKMFFHIGFRNKKRVYPTFAGMDQINRFITIKGFIMLTKANHKTGTLDVDYIFDLDYKPCSQVKDRRVMEDLQWHEQSQKFVQNLGLCPELAGGQDKYYVQSKTQDPPATRLRIHIFPCSLPNPSDCAQLSEFQEAQIVHTRINKVFDLSNFEEPLTSIVEMDGVQLLEPNFSKNLFYKVRDYEVWDDTRDFFEQKLRVRSAGYFLDGLDSRSRDSGQLHCDAALLDDPLQLSCTPFMTMLVSSSGEKQITVRTYPKFFATLGEIGGTAELLFLFIGLIYFQYNAYYLKKYIKSEVLKIESAAGLRRIFPDLKMERDYGKVNPIGYQSTHTQITSRGNRDRVKKEEVSEGVDSSVQQERTNNPQKKSNNRSDEKISLKVEELIDKQIEKNMSGISLCKSLNHLEILMKIFFKPRHKKLLPVILLNLINKNPKNKDVSEKDHTKDPCHQLGLDLDEEKFSMEQAYQKITKNQPKTEIEKIMDDFFIEHAPDYFKNHENYKNSSPHPQSRRKWNEEKAVHTDSCDYQEARKMQRLSTELEQQRGFRLENIEMGENGLKTLEDDDDTNNNNFHYTENSYRSSKQSIIEGSPFEGLSSTRTGGGGVGSRYSKFKHLGSIRNLGSGLDRRKSGQFTHKNKKMKSLALEDKKILSSRRQIVKLRKISNSQMKSHQQQRSSFLNFQE